MPEVKRIYITTWWKSRGIIVADAYIEDSVANIINYDKLGPCKRVTRKNYCESENELNQFLDAAKRKSIEKLRKEIETLQDMKPKFLFMGTKG